MIEVIDQSLEIDDNAIKTCIGKIIITYMIRL